MAKSRHDLRTQTKAVRQTTDSGGLKRFVDSNTLSGMWICGRQEHQEQPFSAYDNLWTTSLS